MPRGCARVAVAVPVMSPLLSGSSGRRVGRAPGAVPGLWGRRSVAEAWVRVVPKVLVLRGGHEATLGRVQRLFVQLQVVHGPGAWGGERRGCSEAVGVQSGGLKL